jgi:hypothetical protein
MRALVGRRRLIATAVLVVAGATTAIAVFAARYDKSSTKASPAGARILSIPVPQAVRNGGYFSQIAAPTRGATPALSTTQESFGEPSLGAETLEPYSLRAYPASRVTIAQAQAARASFQRLPLKLTPSISPNVTSSLALTERWQLLGPVRAKMLPYEFTNLVSRPSVISGRITALAVGRRCLPGNCRLYAGSAGGGVFRTDNALAATPAWTSISEGLTSISIGALAVDSRDRTGKTVYVGTGDSSASTDSEAGLGVFKTTNGGTTWKLLPGSQTAAKDRGISSIALDPRDPATIYISTLTTVHGASSVAGGYSQPPGAPPVGVYRSTDGGKTFSALFRTRIQEPWAGARQVALDPNDPESIFISVVSEGIFRSSRRADGDTVFHRIFTPANPSRYGITFPLFALADLGRATRIYVSDSDPLANPTPDGNRVASTHLWRLDNALARSSAALAARRPAAGWKLLSSAKIGSPGFAAYRYCQVQCNYSNFIASPPGKPNFVWLGGTFDYPDATTYPRSWSNGRTVLRSQDGGLTFTDVTADAQSPTYIMHPDQHTIAFSPTNHDIAFIGSDGGLVRTSGRYVNLSSRCLSRGLFPLELRHCRRLLRAAPSRIFSLNNGLSTLQFQSVSVSPPGTPLEVMGGTQDNGTWSYTPSGGWVNAAGGDGGQSVVGKGRRPPHIHTYYGATLRVNHQGFNPMTWRYIFPPLRQSGERASFYVPLIADPVEAGTLFVGLQRVWRAPQYGGVPAVLDRNCDGVYRLEPDCGGWIAIGEDLTGPAFGVDRGGLTDDRRNFVAALARAPGDSGTLWAATVPGRVFVSTNANAPDFLAVKFTRIDIATAGSRRGTPGRFVSGIVVDPADPLHAWVSYSGYNANTPADQAGHVFEVRVNQTSGRATWKNVSYDLSDQPITGLARHPRTGDLYAATDFGVLRLAAGANRWTEAAEGLPLVAVYGLTMAPDGKTLYAATHGRGVWTLPLSS